VSGGVERGEGGRGRYFFIGVECSEEGCGSRFLEVLNVVMKERVFWCRTQ
jgi:hypothetical protein